MTLILTPEALSEVVAHYSSVEAFAFDVETVGSHRGEPVRNTVLWLSLATAGRADVIPMGHPHGEFVDHIKPLSLNGLKRQEKGLPPRESDYKKTGWTKVWGPAPEQLTPAEVFKALEPIFFGPAIKVAHNLKFDVESITKYYRGKIPTGPYFDTLTAALLVNNLHRGKASLDAVTEREIGYEMVKGVGKEVEAHAFSEVYKYSYLDAKYNWLIYKALDEKIQKQKMTKLMRLEMDLMEAVIDMELTGAPIDEAALSSLHDRLQREIDLAVGDCYRHAGVVFNLNSNAEKQRLLYLPKKMGGQGLNPKGLTPSGKKAKENDDEQDVSHFAVDEAALSFYRYKNPLVGALLKYSELNKLFSTYVLPYHGGVTKKNGEEKSVESLLFKGRVHARFNQMGADTGRFTSSGPNLQNIPNPSRSDNGKEIRNCFVAPPGHKLIVADYSQIEPRIIASFSKDPLLCKTYRNGEDIYMAIANQMSVDRNVAKTLVLAISYGTGPQKIMEVAACKKSEAEDLLNGFKRRFKSITDYQMSVVKEARSRRPYYVTTYLGRRRYLPELFSPDEGLRRRAERQAFNTKIQGSAADIIKLAMIRSYRSLPDGAKMILTVHDEIVSYAPENLLEEAVESIRSSMEDLNFLDVPLVADIKVVNRWGEAK